MTAHPPGLRVHTTLLSREMPGGAVLVAPVPALALASYGPEGHCAVEQQLFLAEHLARVAPEEAARFQLPDGVRLVETDVLVPREELPRRLRIRTPLRVHAVVIPDARGQWVTVPCLDHTFYLPQGDDLEKAIADEVVRLAGARELKPLEYLQLLPPERVELVPVELTVERSERLPPGSVASLRKALRDRERERWAREVLSTVATPLHERIPREAPALAGRDHELRQLTALLDGTRRRSVLVTGPSLAGKSCLVHAWLRARLSRGVATQAWATSGSQLIAGMSGLGQWEERVRRVMEAVAALDAVLVFDNLADLLSDRASGHADIPAALKPWIEEGRVRVVGELRADLVDAAERMHGALLATMGRLRVDATDAAVAREALRVRAAWHRAQQPDGPAASPRCLDALVDLAERYLPYESFPGKAVRLYDDLRALSEAKRTPTRSSAALDADDAHAFFSLQSGIPLFLLREDAALRLDDVRRSLSARMVGQEEAVRRVAETVCVVKARLQPAGRPLATLLFVGPTGVGKTELARGLAALLFGSEERLVRFDMSEFTDLEAADRLIRGHHGAEGMLTRRVREQPFCVVLLDEIEKAHGSVFDLLLQVCGEARLTDGRGRTAYFHNAIVIMTSNLGVSSLREAVGFGASRDDPSAHYLRVVDKHFRPEFVNRIDRVVAFAPLTPEEIARVASLALTRIEGRRGLAATGARLRVGSRALALLCRDGYSARYGARALRRHLEDHLVAPIARMMSEEVNATLAQVTVTADDDALDVPDTMIVHATRTVDALTFTLYAPRLYEQRDASHTFERVTSCRRAADRAMLYPRVEALREQIEFLVLQNDQGDDAERHRPRGIALQELRASHHRLDLVWQALVRGRDDLVALEDLALEGFLQGSIPNELAEESTAAWERFDAVVGRCLIALEPRRDGVTLLVTELDGHRALDRWLPALVAACARRGWREQVHFDGDAARADESWPGDRRWGPPREGDAVVERVTDATRTTRNVLVRVSGPDAGALLALEAGRTAWSSEKGADDAPMLYARLIQMDANVHDTQWKHPALVPDTPNVYAERRRERVNREHAVNGWVRLRDGKWAGPFHTLDAYFNGLERVAGRDLTAYELDETLPRDARFTGTLDEPVAESSR